MKDFTFNLAPRARGLSSSPNDFFWGGGEQRASFRPSAMRVLDCQCECQSSLRTHCFSPSLYEERLLLAQALIAQWFQVLVSFERWFLLSIYRSSSTYCCARAAQMNNWQLVSSFFLSFFLPLDNYFPFGPEREREREKKKPANKRAAVLQRQALLRRAQHDGA